MKRGKYHSRPESLFSKNILNSKRSQAGIIEVILLVLLVMGVIVVVIATVVPFVRDKLASGDCFDVVGPSSMEISRGYTCYDESNDRLQVQVGIGTIKDLIGGFLIEIGGASTKNYKIKNNALVTDVHMYGSAPGTNVILHTQDNTEKTYVIENVFSKPDFIKIYPILKNDKTCEASDSEITIDNC